MPYGSPSPILADIAAMQAAGVLPSQALTAQIQALVSAAGNWPLSRILALGTSITNLWGDSGTAGSSRNTSSDSYLVWFLAAMRGVIKPNAVINKGVAGNNTTQMVARYAADVAANYASFDTLIFEPGPNDYTAPLTFATIQSNITSIVSSATGAGKFVILLTPTPSESPSQSQYAVWQEVRNWLLNTYAIAQVPMVRLVDVASLMADPLTGLPLSTLYHPTSVEATRVHPSMSGAQVMGRAMAETFPVARAIERQTAIGARDHYEWIPNPRLQGNNAAGARNFYAGAGITVTGGPDSAGIGIIQGTFTSVTIAPVTADGTNIAAAANGTRLTFNAAGSDRSLVTLRVGSSDAGVGGTQYERWDTAWAATTAQVFGDHRTLAADATGVLTCITGGTTGGTAPTSPGVFGQAVTDGTVTWLWQKIPLPGDVVTAEVEYEIESVTGGVAIKVQPQICRTVNSEQFAIGAFGNFDSSTSIGQGLPGVWMPRKGVITGLPLTLTALGFAVRHVFVDLTFMFPAGASAVVRIDRVSLRHA